MNTVEETAMNTTGKNKLMTVKEVSKLTGVSIRTLQYYDRIGLLRPASRTDSGYRLYDDTSLEKLQQILLFRELEFSLKEIQEIVDAPNFDKHKALNQQIKLLELKMEHLETLISYARRIKEKAKIRELDPSEASVQLLVKSLQDYISANYYTCAECSHTGC